MVFCGTGSTRNDACSNRAISKQPVLQGVYRIFSEGKTLTLPVKDFAKPNGLAFTPDGKTLYINDTERGHIRAFDVAADGWFTNSRLFAQTPCADGMKVDTAGNVYGTSQSGVMVFDRTGKSLGTFVTPEQPANCGFGANEHDIRGFPHFLPLCAVERANMTPPAGRRHDEVTAPINPRPIQFEPLALELCRCNL